MIRSEQEVAYRRHKRRMRINRLRDRQRNRHHQPLIVEHPIVYHEHHEYLHKPPEWVEKYPQFQPAMSVVMQQVTKVSSPTTTPGPETTTQIPGYMSPVAQVFKMQVNPDGSIQPVDGSGGDRSRWRNRKRNRNNSNNQNNNNNNPFILQSQDYIQDMMTTTTPGPNVSGVQQVISQQGIQLMTSNVLIDQPAPFLVDENIWIQKKKRRRRRRKK